LKKNNYIMKLLNIVDENDNIIGTEERKVIHEKGLLHREVRAWLVTPNNEIIFQHRSKTKDTLPDLLDISVAGHVEIGDSYEEAAVREVEEETGVKIKESDLRLIGKIRRDSEDKSTETSNGIFEKMFIFTYRGDIKDLKIEQGEAIGFEVFTIEQLLNMSEAEKGRFISYIYNFATTKLADFLNK